MLRSLACLSVVLFSLSTAALAAEPPPEKSKPAKTEASAEKCEHGVKKTICTRCNPKLEAVYKAKGDWCGDHGRPESQCAVCKPDLAKQGVK